MAGTRDVAAAHRPSHHRRSQGRARRRPPSTPRSRGRRRASAPHSTPSATASSSSPSTADRQHVWEQDALDELRSGDVADRVRRLPRPRPSRHRRHTRRPPRHRPRPTGTPPAPHGDDPVARRHPCRSPAVEPVRPPTSSPPTVNSTSTTRSRFAGRDYAVGDHVVLCRNHPRPTPLLGRDRSPSTTACAAPSPISRPNSMTITITTGEHVVLDRDYLDRGWVDHAYAITIHKAQGVTCDSVFVVGPAGLYREGAYVALSRARYNAWLYATSLQAADLDEAPPPRHPAPHRSSYPTPKPNSSPDCNISAAEEPRHHRRPATPDRRRPRRTRSPHQNCCAEPATPPPPNTTAAFRIRPKLRADLDAAVADSHATSTSDDASVPSTATTSATSSPSTTPPAHASSTSKTSTDAPRSRILDWAELVVIDDPDPQSPSPTAAPTPRPTRHRRRKQPNRTGRSHSPPTAFEPGDADAVPPRRPHIAADHAARQLQADPPEWLTTWLGPRPETPGRSIGLGRRHHPHRPPPTHPRTSDTEPGIGPRPTDAARSRPLATI